jgi:peptide/nickel transport system substrate-binding protein
MSDWTVADLAKEYKAGQISRRRFVNRMVGAGLTMPVIAAVLQACGSEKESSSTPSSGLATAAAPSGTQAADFQPTKRGGGGTVRVLWWQAPVLLNAHLASGTKDYDASRLFTEPLAAYDPNGEVFPILAAEAPSIEKGTVDAAGSWVVWRLKKDAAWHDGQPFTAEDVLFTYEYIADPATAATTLGSYSNIASVDKVDDHTVKINFKEPTPFWSSPFVGSNGHVFPKHLIAPFKGAESRNSPYNLKPVGTGPYKYVDFRPGDNVIGELNDKYHMANRPYFDRIDIKGGGDAPAAARAVLQTGEMDFAWNMQVETDVLADLEKNGLGNAVINIGASTEHIEFNFSDPWTEVDGEQGSAKSKHPFLSDLKVRQAFTLAVNRQLIVESLYGPQGDVGLYYLFNPKKYVPDGGTWEYNLDKANQLLDEAGWRRGSDGTRQKDGKRMKVLYQTAVNSVRQKTQAIVKQDLEKLGVEVELKSVISDVYFGQSTNSDSWPQFSADLQMFTNGPGAPDPGAFLEQWTSGQVAQKANKWSGRNAYRYQNPAYDTLYQQQRVEMDPIKRADIVKKMNQLLIDDAVFVPVVNRHGVSAAKKDLKGMDLTTWDSNFWKLPFWHRG